MPEHTPAPTPSRAVYGFVLYLASNILFLLYLLWAIIPIEWFEAMNITYLPRQYWAVAIPIFLLTTLATFAFIIYPSLNLCLTPKINDIRTMMEVKSKSTPSNSSKEMHENQQNFCSCKNKEKCFRNEYLKSNKMTAKYAVPMVKDLCMDEVSKLLYLK